MGAVSFDGLWMKLRDSEQIRLGRDVPHVHHDSTTAHRLVIITEGEGSIETEYSSYPIKQGDAWICLPGQVSSLCLEASGSLLCHSLQFDVYQEESADNQATITMTRTLFPFDGVVSILSHSVLFALCSSIDETWHQPDKQSCFRSQTYFQELLHELLTSAAALTVEDSLDMVEQTRLYLENHFQENWTIDRLAEMAGLSPYYYMHLFKKTYGKSAMDYLTELRINQAKQLMGKTNERLREIARQVGYSDEFYFSRKFKQQQGMAPTIYMKSRRHKIATYHTAITGQLLALQMIPCAAPLDPKWSAYYRQKYAIDIPVHLKDPFVLENWETNREALLRSGVDSIITSDYLDQAVKNELGGMANSLFVPWKEENWRVHLQMIGEYLGRDKEAQKWIHSYDQKVNAARQVVGRAVGEDSLLMVYINASTLYVCGSQRTGSVLYGDLQLRPVTHVESLFAYEQVTFEELLSYDADRLIVIVKRDQPSRTYWNKLQGDVRWQEQRAVQNRHVYEVAPDPWLEYSAVGHDRIVEELLHLFAQDDPK